MVGGRFKYLYQKESTEKDRGRSVAHNLHVRDCLLCAHNYTQLYKTKKRKPKSKWQQMARIALLGWEGGC